MDKTISELMFQRFSFLENLDSCNIRSRKQIDYLRFYVPLDKQLLYGTPFMGSGVRDNPNMEKTEYQNVYKMTDYKYSLRVYCIPNVSPVSVLRWGKVKVQKDGEYQELMEICIYGKALALYYAGHLTWLDEFVSKYQGECSRVDICYDINSDLPSEKYPGDVYTDLKCTAMFPYSNRDEFSTVYYGNKHSPMFIRVYDKTEDLRVKDKNIHSFIYPKWYLEKCRRIEFELKGKYSKLASPLDWLKSLKRDFKIKPLTQSNRNNYKTALYSLVNCLDLINCSDGEKIIILQNVKELINCKLKNLYSNKV